MFDRFDPRDRDDDPRDDYGIYDPRWTTTRAIATRMRATRP